MEGSPAVPRLALGSGDKTVSILDGRTGKRELHLRGLHTDFISIVAWSAAPPAIPEAVPPAAATADPLPQLCAMGFVAERAAEALAACDGDLAQAVQSLVEQREKAKASAELQQERLQAAAEVARAESRALLAQAAADAKLAAADHKPEPEPQLEPSAAADPFTSELAGLKVRALKKRARSLGATSEQIDALDDADDIKAATIELVKSLRSALDAMSFRELKRLLRSQGASDDAIDDLDDSDDPKVTGVQLALQIAAGGRPSATRTPTSPVRLSHFSASLL